MEGVYGIPVNIPDSVYKRYAKENAMFPKIYKRATSNDAPLAKVRIHTAP